MRPEEGLCLGGRYELRSRLAVGGMGEVWVTRDLSLERSVATKVLRPELADDERFLAYLRAEARTSAPLTHPNIAALYDYGEDADGAGYLVMELVTGEPLSDVLSRERVLETEALLSILAQAARALHAAHVGGVIHRDVKPSNILITPDGRVKITDFGISVGTQDRPSTPRGTVQGTVHYLSPEQALGRDATPASDIYALGVVAYEAAVGRRPFTGSSLIDIAHAQVNEPVPPFPDHVPSGVCELIGRMLEKHPERRPRSAASLARSIDRVAKELELARPFDKGAGLAEGLRDGADAYSETDDRREPSLETVPLEAPLQAPWPVRDADPLPSVACAPAADVADAAAAYAAPARPAARDTPPSAEPTGPRPARHRHRRPRTRWSLAWAWMLLAVAITAVLGLAAYRLAESVGNAPGGRTVLGQGPSARAADPSGDGFRTAGNAPWHQADVEDSSW